MADILNYFIVEGVDIDRQANPSLHDLALIEQSGYGVNRLRYMSKSELKAGMTEDGGNFYQTEYHLDNFLRLK